MGKTAFFVYCGGWFPRCEYYHDIMYTFLKASTNEVVIYRRGEYWNKENIGMQKKYEERVFSLTDLQCTRGWTMSK